MDWKSLSTICACRKLINNQCGALNVIFIVKSFGNPAKITTYPFTHVNCVRQKGSRQHQEDGTDLLGARRAYSLPGAGPMATGMYSGSSE